MPHPHFPSSYKERNSLAAFHALGLHSSQYYEIGILVGIWVAIYMLLRFLFCAMEWYLPSMAPTDVPFESIWIAFSAWNDVKVFFQRFCNLYCVGCCARRFGVPAAEPAEREYTMRRTLRLSWRRWLSGPAVLAAEARSLRAFIVNQFSGFKYMTVLWAAVFLLSFSYPAMLRHRLKSIELVEACSVLLAIVVVVWLPSIRVWRALGFRFTPPLLLVITTVLSIVAYELTVRFYLVRT